MSKNYNLEREDGGIRITLKNGAGTDYFSSNDAFLEILDKWHATMSHNVMTGRLEADMWKGKWRDHIRVYMYDVALACYLGMVHPDTLVDDLREYHAWRKAEGLTTIDHLDSNFHNNIAENISPMSRSANNRKRSFPAGFVGPYTLTTAYVDGEYRVQLSLKNTVLDSIQQLLDHALPGAFRVNGAGVSALHFICPDENSFVACLKHLYGSRFSWCNPGETAKDYKRAHKDSAYMAADVERSIAAQRTLARMDRSQFQIFTAGEFRGP